MTLEYPPFPPSITRALTHTLRLPHPTTTQHQILLPLLENQSILLKARTGTGKTVGYAIAAVVNAVTKKQNTIILLPTKELGIQVGHTIRKLITYAPNAVRITNHLLEKNNKAVNEETLPNMGEIPEITISTPTRALTHIRNGSLSPESIKTIIVDEADLMVKYGYENDFQLLIAEWPHAYQGVLVSATMSEDVQKLGKLMLRQPLLLDIKETLEQQSLLSEFRIPCALEDRYLFTYYLLSSRLKGKTLIFADNVTVAYKLSLFLKAFQLKSMVYDAHLPIKSRMQALADFNRGTVPILVATDSQADDKEYGVARGIDFLNITTVINFHLPVDGESYTHRIGRTARGNCAGAAVTFYDPAQVAKPGMDYVIPEWLAANSKLINMDADTFRYRCADALRSVTSVRVKEAARESLRQAIASSERLSEFWSSHPLEFDVVGKAKTREQVKVGGKSIPSYLQKDWEKGVDAEIRVEDIRFHRRNRMLNKQKSKRGGKKSKKAL